LDVVSTSFFISALKPAELDVLRRQYEQDEAGGYVGPQTKFNLAWVRPFARKSRQTSNKYMTRV